jgi:hypothetical protein
MYRRDDFISSTGLNAKLDRLVEVRVEVLQVYGSSCLVDEVEALDCEALTTMVRLVGCM